MISNYITSAFRNLLKHRLFSGINIFGLGLSMSVCLFILLLIRSAYGYDNFHPQGERIYRVNTNSIRKGGDQEPYATSPWPLGATLATGFSQIEAATRIASRVNGEVSGNGKVLPIRGMLAEPSFFDVFGFSLLEGNAASVLNEPFSIVLSQKAAERFFPRTEAIGKTLKINAYGEFQVTGVLAEVPGKTHLEFDALISAASVPALEKDSTLNVDFSKNWNDIYSTYTYVRLRDGVPANQLNDALASIAKLEYSNRTLESRDAGYEFFLQPLNGITPGPMLSNNMGRGIPNILLWFLMVLGGVVMLSACFNYTNLTLARAISRAREIGVRKVMGASRWQVAGQLLGEGVITALFALGIGWLLMKLVQPAFNSLSFTQDLDVSVQEDGVTTLWFLGFAVAVGLLAGALPALAMSRISPSSVLQRLANLRFFKHLGLRKALLISQFAVSLVFIIMVTAVSKQIGFMAEMDYGFNTSQLLNVELQGQSPEKIIPILSAVPGVERISAMSHTLGTHNDMAEDVRVTPEAEKTPVREYFVDKNFFENLQLSLVAGENFPEKPAASQREESFAIVNEQFCEKFQLGTPAEALGKQILMGDSGRLIVRGVVKDFLFRAAENALEPLLLRNSADQWRLLTLKIAPGDPQTTVVTLQRAWSQAVPDRPMESEFYDQAIERNFAEFRDVLSIIGVFALLGIVIAALGLLGMATYTVETRMKEVGLVFDLARHCGFDRHAHWLAAWKSVFATFCPPHSDGRGRFAAGDFDFARRGGLDRWFAGLAGSSDQSGGFVAQRVIL
jgi:putative ABC transport system permease protein